jgi:hypothetical protein
MTRSATSTSAALVAALLISLTASAQAPGDRPIAGLSLETTQPLIAKVAAIDQANRTVTLVTPDGTTVTRRVSSLVQNLGDLRVGDTVAVLYKEGLTFVASEPNAPTPPGDAKMAGLAVQAPDVTVGTAAAKAVRNYYVVGVDPAARTVSIVDTDGGAIRTFKVMDDVAQAQLAQLKPGYKLTIYDSQAVVAAITKQA